MKLLSPSLCLSASLPLCLSASVSLSLSLSLPSGFLCLGLGLGLGLGLYGSLSRATMMANAVPFLRHLHMDQLIEVKRKLLASLQSSFFLCCARQSCLLPISVITLDTPNQTRDPFFSALSLTLLRLSPIALSSRPAFAGTSSTIFLLINTKLCSPSPTSHHDSGQIVPCTCLPSLGSSQIPRPSQHLHVAVILRDPRHRSRLLFRSNLSLSNSASDNATRAPQPALTVPQDVVYINSFTARQH